LQRPPLLPTIIAALVLLFVVAGHADGKTLTSGLYTPPIPGLYITQTDRNSCDAIRNSDLRSPTEGVWFQTHCSRQVSNRPGLVAATGCNGPAREDPALRPITDRLFAYRQSTTSRAYLWYASAPDCLDLVSDQVVTAVCADQAVSFNWDANAACYGHGGVLARVNGQ
jgi:hypothetical protein